MYLLSDVKDLLNKNQCKSCYCVNASYDDGEPEEEIYLSIKICDFVGSTQYTVTAYKRITMEKVWEKECDTSDRCSIPFSFPKDTLKCTNGCCG